MSSKVEHPNAPRPDGLTPIHVAARCGHMEVIEFLGPKVEKPNAPKARLSGWTPISDGWTPIHFAVEYGHAEIVEFLAPLAENPFAPRPNFDGGETPLLLLAANNDHEDVFKILLEIMPLKMILDFKKKHKKLYNKFSASPLVKLAKRY